ncbi:hypothetical protein [Streptomyces atratus]|uniref:hypothetical protein n=1 Tax=Streptomyces atratus TaxID=1893 RepID=UPI003668551F
MDLNEKTTLTAYAEKDPRGLDLIQVYVSTRGLGLPKYARFNSFGGLTYVQNRANSYSRPKEPTMIVSEDEAKILSSSLMCHLYGPNWGASAEEMERLSDQGAELDRQNREMRRKKKQVEHDLAVARAELKELKDLARRHEEVMQVVRAVNFRPTQQIPGSNQ